MESVVRRESITRRPAAAFVLLTTVAAQWLIWFPAIAVSADPARFGHIARLENCHDLFNIVTVPMDRVEELVPDGYRVRSDTGGATANLVVDIFDCERVSVAGKSLGRVRGADVAVEIERPEGSDPPDDDSQFLFDQYVLFIITDNAAYAEWLRDGTGLGVTHVKGIELEFARPELGADRFRFWAPSPSPSPFHVEGVVSAQRKQGFPVDDSWWQDTRTTGGREWTVRLHHPWHPDYFAPGNAMITAEEGSELARIIDTPTATTNLSLSLFRDGDQVKSVTRLPR